MCIRDRGCTATAAYIEGTTLAIAHVGDSRAYLLHEGTLIRVTRDHSYVCLLYTSRCV